MSIPVFGEPRGDRAIERPAAYALLRTAEGVAVVRAAGGKLFLPGGGILESESPEEAVRRELREECRIEAACVGRHSEAVQHFTARREGVAYRSHMFFLECRRVANLPGRGEHETRWLPEPPDRGDFAHEAHYRAFCAYVGG